MTYSEKQEMVNRIFGEATHIFHINKLASLKKETKIRISVNKIYNDEIDEMIEYHESKI